MGGVPSGDYMAFEIKGDLPRIDCDMTFNELDMPIVFHWSLCGHESDEGTLVDTVENERRMEGTIRYEAGEYVAQRKEEAEILNHIFGTSYDERSVVISRCSIAGGGICVLTDNGTGSATFSLDIYRPDYDELGYVLEQTSAMPRNCLFKNEYMSSEDIDIACSAEMERTDYAYSAELFEAAEQIQESRWQFDNVDYVEAQNSMSFKVFFKFFIVTLLLWTGQDTR